MKKPTKSKSSSAKRDAIAKAVEHQTKIAWTFLISAGVLSILHFSLSANIFMLTSSLNLISDQSVMLLSFSSATTIILSSLLALYYFLKRNDTLHAEQASAKKKSASDIYHLIHPDMKSWKYLFAGIWFTYYITMMVPFVGYN